MPDMNAVLEAVDHAVVFVEPIGHAYSQIKRVRPDLIVLCLADEDRCGCQFLSMLTFDRETARIPVVTYLEPASSDAAESSVGDDPLFEAPVLLSLN
jgi:hypothetical protein